MIVDFFLGFGMGALGAAACFVLFLILAFAGWMDNGSH